MVTLTAEKGTLPTLERGGAALANLMLRVGAAGLQTVATLAIVSLLPSDVAGVYFKGFVITFGLAAVLRGKYDLFVARHFLGQPLTSVPDRELVRGLGIRILVRSAIACAGLLVVTADLDVMEPHLRPYLETYLPFVLAVPMAALALFLSSVLRASNRAVSSLLVSTVGINVVIMAAVRSASGSEETILALLSWGFFAGTLVAAVTGVLVTRSVFSASPAAGRTGAGPIAWREIYAAVGDNGMTGLALAGLQWGPLGLLALLGTEIQLADYVVVLRTAQAVEFLLPVAVLVPLSVRSHARISAPVGMGRRLIVDLSASLVTTTASVIAVAVATPWIVALYGVDYSSLTILFAVAFAAQWINGVSRPAIRHLAAHWNRALLRRILWVSAIAAMTISAAGITEYGALAAAAGVLLGALLLNSQALINACSHIRTSVYG